MKCKEDLGHLHAFMSYINLVFEEELHSGLDGAEESRVQDLYNKLKHYYDTTLAISKKVDDMF
jgi:hypothetical protein